MGESAYEKARRLSSTPSIKWMKEAEVHHKNLRDYFDNQSSSDGASGGSDAGPLLSALIKHYNGDEGAAWDAHNEWESQNPRKQSRNL